MEREGWGTPKPAVIPPPTAWPSALALAIVLVAWGLLTSLTMLGAGVILFAVSLAGWIGDLRHGKPPKTDPDDEAKARLRRGPPRGAGRSPPSSPSAVRC